MAHNILYIIFNNKVDNIVLQNVNSVLSSMTMLFKHDNNVLKQHHEHGGSLINACPSLPPTSKNMQLVPNIVISDDVSYSNIMIRSPFVPTSTLRTSDVAS